MESLNWIKDKEVITQVYYTAINANNIELIKIVKDNYSKLERVYPLIEYVIERTNAVSVLIDNDLVWDADIVIRSALETLSKFMLISDAKEVEREALLNEFWKDLSEIYKIKIHEQAKKNLKHTPTSETHLLAYSPLILSEEEETRLKSKWPKSDRSKLEQKWSFTGIVNYLSQKNQGTPMEMFELLTHSYRMSSHITHGDEFGISLIQERKSRNAQEQNEVHIAHYLRLLSDCFYYCMAASIFTAKYLSISNEYFVNLSNSLNEIDILVQKYHKAPFNDVIYDKYK